MKRTLLTLGFLAGCAIAADWPQWRGPAADGISRETGVPWKWSQSESVLWKAPLGGLGTSTPIVARNHVFVTVQIGDGPFEGRSRDFDSAAVARRTGDQGQVRFAVLAFDRQSGKPLWTYNLPAKGALPAVHIKHNLASPSVLADADRIYAWFGTGQLVALDYEGKPVWERHLGEEIAPFDVLWGHGSSPALYQDTLFLLCDHPSGAYLLALDRRTGKQLWKLDRGEEKRSYTTPLLIRSDGKDQLILNSSQRIDALDPRNGELLWSAGEPNRVPVPTPVFHEGVLYTNRGYNSSPYLAVRPGGQVEWRVNTGGPYVSSLLYYEGLIYMANERGIVTVADAKTGATVWRDRFEGVFSASPVAAEGRVYLTNEDGKTWVLQAGREKKILAENDLGERTLASLAIAGSRIYLRTDNALYCIGSK